MQEIPTDVAEVTEFIPNYKELYETLLENYARKTDECSYLLTFVDQFKKKEYCEGGQVLARTIKDLHHTNDMQAELINELKKERARNRCLTNSYNNIIKMIQENFEIKLAKVLAENKINVQIDVMNASTGKIVLSEAVAKTEVETVSKRVEKVQKKLDKKNEECSSLMNQINNLRRELKEASLVSKKVVATKSVSEITNGMGELNITEEDIDVMTIFTSVKEIKEAIPNFLSYRRLSNKLKKPAGRFAIFMNPNCSMSWSRSEKCFGNSLNHAELFGSFFAALKQAYFIRKRGIYDGVMYIREVNCSIYDIEGYAFKIEKEEDVSKQMTEYISDFGSQSVHMKKQIDKQLQQVNLFETMFGGDDHGWSW